MAVSEERLAQIRRTYQTAKDAPETRMSHDEDVLDLLERLDAERARYAELIGVRIGDETTEREQAFRREQAIYARGQILDALEEIRGLIEDALEPTMPVVEWVDAPAPETAEGWGEPSPGLAETLAQIQPGTIASPAEPPEGTQFTFVPPNPLAAAWDALGRLTFLLGLSNEESAFVAEAAARAKAPGAAYDGLLVFADWLEDAMRPAHAEAVRRLVPADGDVLIWRVASGVLGEAEIRAGLRELCEEMREALAKAGRRVHFCAMPASWDLTHLTPAQLLETGLMRVKDHEAVIGAELRAMKVVPLEVHRQAQQDHRARIDLLEKENAAMRERCKELQSRASAGIRKVPPPQRDPDEYGWPS